MREMYSFKTSSQQKNMKIFFFCYLFRVFSRCMFEKYLYVNNSSDAYLVNECMLKRKNKKKNGKHFPLCCKLRVPMRTFSSLAFFFLHSFVDLHLWTVEALHSATYMVPWLAGYNVIFSLHSWTINDFVKVPYPYHTHTHTHILPNRGTRKKTFIVFE